MMDKIQNEIKTTNREVKVLNLFAYTGGATVACLYAGASVCHVDSSKEWLRGQRKCCIIKIARKTSKIYCG